MFNIKVSPRFDEIIQKLEKKNIKQVEIILKKAGEIAETHIDIITYERHSTT